MAFIRQKVSRGRAAFYVVESVRDGGKVHQKVLAYLGPCDTIEGAIAHWDNKQAKWQARVPGYRASAAAALARVHPAWIERNGGKVPEGRGRGIKFRTSVCAQYWAWTRTADKLEQEIERIAARLVRLRALV